MTHAREEFARGSSREAADDAERSPYSRPRVPQHVTILKTWAVKGHRFGLDLPAEEKKALIALLKNAVSWNPGRTLDGTFSANCRQLRGPVDDEP
jgi:hypothetical protein